MTRLEDRTGWPKTPYTPPLSTCTSSDQRSLAATAKTTYVELTSTSSGHWPIKVAVRDVTLPFKTPVTRTSTTFTVSCLPSSWVIVLVCVTGPWNTTADIRVLDGTSSNCGLHVAAVDAAAVKNANRIAKITTTAGGQRNIISCRWVSRLQTVR